MINVLKRFEYEFTFSCISQSAEKEEERKSSPPNPVANFFDQLILKSD
jgi:hypothetical protein